MKHIIVRTDYRVSISGLSGPWLAGNSYTLTCIANADINPQVNWIDPSGNYIVEKERTDCHWPCCVRKPYHFKPYI